MMPAEKLAWLRKYVDPDLPDIYAMADQGFTPNGCGPEKSKWLSALIPDDLPFLPCFEVAGDYHDYLYWRGGNEADKIRADLMLSWIMMELGRQSVRWWNPVSWSAPLRMKPVADGYYEAVRLGGKEHFNYHRAAMVGVAPGAIPD
jgi:hypothetical protein